MTAKPMPSRTRSRICAVSILTPCGRAGAARSGGRRRRICRRRCSSGCWRIGPRQPCSATSIKPPRVCSIASLIREAGRSARPGPGRDQARHRAGARVGVRFPSRHGDGRGLRLERVHLSEPLQGGPRDHRHALERPALLQPAGSEGQGRMTKPAQRMLRCAIYTRVSTEHGLEQDFNSLDAQREAGRAYVRSQTHEGWLLVKESFDDGGFSGGSLERPALQRLLAAIRSRLIDVVVVYKVDRLTRSLADFAKLVEIFDGQGVSFVSVTQSFNTTTSMGRLTLNMLLSFAQFEREVTGERIRDKLAASKRRGIWVGGIVPRGYEGRHRKLMIREDEAATVRLIFERYLALGSLPALQRDLRERGIVTRVRTLGSGRTVGGVPLTNGPLAYLLRNRVYLGELNHKGASHPGQHEPIIAPALFDAVQEKLTANRNGHRVQR